MWLTRQWIKIFSIVASFMPRRKKLWPELFLTVFFDASDGIANGRIEPFSFENSKLCERSTPDKLLSWLLDKFVTWTTDGLCSIPSSKFSLWFSMNIESQEHTNSIEKRTQKRYKEEDFIGIQYAINPIVCERNGEWPKWGMRTRNVKSANPINTPIDSPKRT